LKIYKTHLYRSQDSIRYPFKTKDPSKLTASKGKSRIDSSCDPIAKIIIFGDIFAKFAKFENMELSKKN